MTLMGESAENPAQDLNELLPIVDSQDREIGSLPRWQVHKESRLHRAVHILVMNSDGEIFLQQRSLRKDSAPGKWDSSSSGHVDPGEAYQNAAIRELHEELGLQQTDSPPHFLGKLPASSETGHEFTAVYLCHSDKPMDLNPAELKGGIWLRPEEVDSLLSTQPEIFARCFAPVWRLARSHLC